MKYSTFERRVTWLLENRSLWIRKRMHPNRVTIELLAHKALVKGMKSAGLIAPSTYWFDCRLTKEIYAARLAVSMERKSRACLRAALAEKNEILSVFEWPDEGSTVDGGRLNHWHCRFCSAALLEGLHKEDCAWLKARKAGE